MTEQISDAEWAEWVVWTCLAFGTSVSTAYQVAGLFVQARDEEEQ